MSPQARGAVRFRTRRRVSMLALLALAAIAIVAGVIIGLSSGIRREIDSSFMRETSDRAELEFRDNLRRLFEPIEAYLRVTERWGERGALDLSDHQALNNLLVPILEQYPFVTSTMIASEHGREYMLLREEGGWLTRATDADGEPGHVHWRRWSSDVSLMEDWWEDTDYDPRRRPWYREATQNADRDAGEIHWTGPYVFLTTKQIGVTLSKPWWAPGEDAGDHVVGVDVPLEAVVTVADTFLTREGGRSFLLNRDGWVMTGERGGTVGADSTVGLRKPDGFEADVLDAWRGSGAGLARQFKFTSGGDSWWVDVRPVELDSTPPWLAVIVPEASFAAKAKGRQHRYVLMLVGLVLLAALVTFVVTRLMPGRGGEMGPDLSTEGALRELIARGEGDHLEFKSTMRWNIVADKPGKEVEMSWLKTVVAFMNGGGGVLVIGVNDEGEVDGIEADRFTSDDKFLLHFNNLFKDHIGLVFRPFVDAVIRPIGGKRVFVVNCRTSSDPVFLKVGKEERFFVRVGPSSRQLAMSEVVTRFRKKGS